MVRSLAIGTLMPGGREEINMGIRIRVGLVVGLGEGLGLGLGPRPWR